MGLFAKRSKSDAVEAIDPADTVEADEQQPAVTPNARSRGFLRKRSKNDAQVCMT